ncbi:MAG TPA: class I SAM-dependent methyltransferase family protein [Gemmatimonadota bacterium]|nr:class I SAM-dependent methyltransferase family protein [Gemmatimonadota bacterium]
MRASPEPGSASGPWVNRTRTSRSIPRRLVREGKLHLVPLYVLMRTSELAREGIENSGSYRFADHVYRGRPEGSLGVGRLLDGALLRLRAARSMRSRYLHSRAGILAAAGRQPPGAPFRVLSVPCGIARELIEAAEILRAEDPALYRRAVFFGIDLDPRPLEISGRMAGGRGEFQFLRADALDPSAYPRGLDIIVSTGFGEFLSDDELVRFYGLCRDALREGGSLVTSGTRRDRLSEYLMRELAELTARYREPAEMVEMLRRAGLQVVSARPDEVGLQTLLAARWGGEETEDSDGGGS